MIIQYRLLQLIMEKISNSDYPKILHNLKRVLDGKEMIQCGESCYLIYVANDYITAAINVKDFGEYYANKLHGIDHINILREELDLPKYRSILDF